MGDTFISELELEDWNILSIRISTWMEEEKDHYKTLGMPLEDIRTLAISSLDPRTGVKFFLFVDKGDVKGFAIGHPSPRIDVINGQYVASNDFFVRALFISKEASRSLSEFVDSEVCSILKSLGYQKVYGHCKPELASAKDGRLGFKSKYVVMEKDLNG